MKENRKYNCLKNQEFSFKNYKLIPLRYEHRFIIMKWRNDQIYHLRQKNKLNKKSQDKYFKEIISYQFFEKNPDQILFSFYDKNDFVAYGGLVHINWIDKNAEISFVINTDLEKQKFKEYWMNFLTLIELVGFKDLKLRKLFIYSFNLRPNLYKVTSIKNYRKEAHLYQHKLIDGNFVDVLIHSKINQ